MSSTPVSPVSPVGPVRTQAAELLRDLDALLLLPRAEQPEALRGLRLRHPAPPLEEAWNTAFGPRSLFDAWTRTTVASAIYQANAATLADRLAARPGWRVVEIGGGDGRLWRHLLDRVGPDGLGRGELVLVDPVAETGDRVRSVLPSDVSVRHIQAKIEDLVETGSRDAAGGAALPDCDALVCSLTLHHLAGLDAASRKAKGLEGPGKAEVLELFARSLDRRGGLGILNEADVHCDLELAPGSPVLLERLLDSYVRRCARSVLQDITAGALAPDDLQRRWLAVAHHWCLAQVELADAPLEDRDVYELDVGRWLAALDAARLEVEDHHFTDRWGLFHRYILRSS